jgi:uncharacterized protein YkwD
MVLRIFIILLALCAASAQAQPVAGSAGEIADALNAIRARGCGGRPAVRTPLQENPTLTRAARLAASGASLPDALSQANYKAEKSALLSLQGPDQAAGIASFVAQRYCEHLLRPEFSEVGGYRSGRRTWIVLTAPFLPPSADDAQEVARSVLQLVNQARAQARQCGNRPMAAAQPVRLNDVLSAAALGHARDMARNNYFDHVGRDGSQPSDRATRAGYRWRMVGENIAAGQTTPQAAVAGWIKSPGHCVNLMRPEYTEMGIAFAVNKATEPGIYWAQLFGLPRRQAP